MKKSSVYICEYCGLEVKEDSMRIMCHEAEHLGLTLEEYEYWRMLNKNAANAGYMNGITHNAETDKEFNMACDELTKFEKAHNLNHSEKPSDFYF